MVLFAIDIIKEVIMLFNFLKNFDIVYDAFDLQLSYCEMDCSNDKGMVIIIIVFVCTSGGYFDLLMHVVIN
jgi:hypothetical protein